MAHELRFTVSDAPVAVSEVTQKVACEVVRGAPTRREAP